MKCRVHYVSPKGSAQAVAEAISRECGCPHEPLLPAYMPENIQLMFLGCEGGKADKITLEFIGSMSSERVRNAALFCCGKGDDAIDQMKKALGKRGVNVLDMRFNAPLKGLFGGGPTEADLSAAREFAKSCIAFLEKE